MVYITGVTPYNLPAINFVSPQEEAQENHILKEEDSMIYTHLEKVLVHMIDEQDAKIFKSHDDYTRNKRKFIQYLKYAEIWQSASVTCSYTAFLSDVLLIVTYHILSKVPQYNAGYACSLYKHEYVWHTSNQS